MLNSELVYRRFQDEINFVGFNSDSGFGGSSNYRSTTTTTSRRHNDVADSPRKSELDGLTPFEKNFYVEAPSVAAMSEGEVEEYRRRREITVEGRDVPNPVKSFQDVGFPGMSTRNTSINLLLMLKIW